MDLTWLCRKTNLTLFRAISQMHNSRTSVAQLFESVQVLFYISILCCCVSIGQADAEWCPGAIRVKERLCKTAILDWTDLSADFSSCLLQFFYSFIPENQKKSNHSLRLIRKSEVQILAFVFSITQGESGWLWTKNASKFAWVLISVRWPSVL